jgi:uncharacterized protein (DUF1778 family)
MTAKLSTPKITISVRVNRKTLEAIKKAAAKEDISLNKFFVKGALQLVETLSQWQHR